MKHNSFVPAALVALFSAAAGATAQPTATSSEIAQWASLMFYYETNGFAHPTASSFQFSNSAMNQAGVLPIAGAIRFFDAMYQDSTDYDMSDCTYVSILTILADIPSARTSFTQYVTGGKHFSSSLAQNSMVHVRHAAAISDATGAANTYTLLGSVTNSGGVLQSWQLSKLIAEPVNATPTVSMTPTETQFDTALRSVVTTIASSGSDVQFNPIKAIKGLQLPNTTRSKIYQQLAGIGWDVKTSVYRLYIGDTIGLSLVHVQFDQKVWIADGGTGVVEGPYALDDVIELSAIPAARFNLTGSASSIGAQLGVMAGDPVDCLPERQWNPIWPENVVPGAPWAPPATYPPNVPPNNPANPGSWSNWNCTPQLTGACFCDRSRTFCQNLRVFGFWGQECTLTRCYTERKACDWVPALSGGVCAPPPPPDADCGITSRLSSETTSGCGFFY